MKRQVDGDTDYAFVGNKDLEDSNPINRPHTFATISLTSGEIFNATTSPP